MMPDYSAIVQSAAQSYNIDPALINAIIGKESSGKAAAFNPAGGGQGAAGLMQVRAPALEDFNAANGTKYTMADLKKPEVGIPVGSWYLGQQLDKFNDPSKALVAYNEGAGSPNVSKGATPYSQSVMSRIGAQQAPAASATLPGIPTSQTAGTPQSDDAIFAQFTKGGAPAQQQTGPQSDDAIFASMMKAAPAQPAPQVPAAQPQQPAQQPGGAMSFLAGLGHGVQETALGAQQLLGHGAQAVGLNNVGNWLVNDANQGLARGNAEYAPYQAAHPIAAGAGNIGGSIAATAPLGVLAPAARTLGGMAAVGAGLGGATAALSPVDPNSQNFAADKLKQIGIGAATGGVLSPLAGLAGRVISPNVNPDVQMLLDRGVTPTPGQIAGGALARTESKLTSAPGIGDAIVAGQRRAIDQFNRATYQDALEQVGQHLPNNIGTGSEGVNYVRTQLGHQYDSIANRASLTADQNLSNDLNAIRNDLAQTAPGTLNQFDHIVNNQLTAKVTGGVVPQGGNVPVGGTMTGNQWNDSRSMIANLSRRQITGNANADNWALHDALDDLTTALNNAVGRSSAPDVLTDLQRANAGWARYKQIEKAAGSTGASNNGNIFTPAQYTSSIRSGSTAAQKGTNSGLNADFANAAQNVLGAKYPDSGTAGRGLMNLLGSGIVTGGLITNPTATLAGLGGVALGSIPYTNLGQRGVAALMTARPQFAQPVGQAVTGLGRLIVPGSLPALLSGSR
jgi:hypothetical protein